MVNGGPRVGEDFHEDEVRVIGFDNPNRRIQRELGPIHLRYLLHGIPPPISSSDPNYLRMRGWTGANMGVVNPTENFNREIELVNNLAERTLTFIQEFGISGRITVITPPRSCPADSNNCSREYQMNHIGHMIGTLVSEAIRTRTSCTVSHVMSFDMYECNFPSVTRRSWPNKARDKYANWIDCLGTETQDSIESSELIVICDDTMISYMSMLRIAISVRMYNQESRILCAGVFGANIPTEVINNGRVWPTDYPDSIYATLSRVLDSQDGR